MAATPSETKKYAQRFLDEGFQTHAFRTLGRTELTCSSLGFGCYRIEEPEPVHQAALTKAVLGGINLIDTSTNYTDGRSEQLVGRVLSQLIREKQLQREQIIVVSKVGYVQGKNLSLAKAKQSKGTAYPDMVKYLEPCWHCIHPSFIEDQLERSLERLQMQSLDVFLLHNPEYYILDALKSNPDQGQVQTEFYRRIAQAFECLESLVKSGKIHHYGVSSNNFGYQSDNPEATSIQKMWDIAEAIQPNHHFSVIQLPANLYETGPIFEKNCSGKTSLQYSKEKNLGVLVNRPLNAITGDQLIRLAEFQPSSDGQDYRNHLCAGIELEKHFIEKIAPELKMSENAPSAEQLFCIAHELSDAQLEQINVDRWKQLEDHRIRPQLAYLIRSLDSQIPGAISSEWKVWQEKYVPMMDTLLSSIRNHFETEANAVTRPISKTLEENLPSDYQEQSLSRKALSVLSHCDGVSSVLNGMRKDSYVEDSIGITKLPAFSVTQTLFPAPLNS